MTKAKLTRIPKRVLACVLAVLMVLSCLTMLPFTGFADNENHAKLESPAVVQGDNGTYYAFGSGNVLYESSDMANWGTAPVEGGYITDDGIGNIIETYERRLDKTIGKTDLSSPEVVKIGDTWYLYISVMSGNTSMILRAPSTEGDANGPYAAFEPVLETGFKRSAADSVLQDYIQKSYNNNAPTLVSEWGKGTCYYYSNFLGLNYQWYTEELPRAYAPSIAQDDEGNYWMAYGYRDGGIWMQKLHKDGENAGLIDFTWSGNNYAALGGWQTSPYQYIPEEHYNTANVDDARLDPYFGELLVHTTEGGDTDTLESSVSRAGEEPELYFVGDQAYLQVTYGGSDNSDGYNVRAYSDDGSYKPAGVSERTWNFVDMKDNTAVANADSTMMAGNSSTRTGLKLMSDYGMPGTNSQQYYTSSGASSVSSNDSGMLFYNYQTRFNKTLDGSTVTAPDSDQPLTEMRSHILLHNVDGDPLVTPFEYTAADEGLYEAAYGENAQQYDIDEEIVGQYYVTMSGSETSTSMANTGGVTLTAGGLVMGAISGSWAFEERRDGSNTNYIVITDDVNHVEYHGALLKQTVEDPTSLKGLTETMTFTAVGNNQTVWGVRYGNYDPAGENNANAHLSISSAIYTGGALALNAATNGQLGLKYGNYITSFSFANIDYSTYLTIDSQYEITNVYDDNDTDGDENGIKAYEVTADLLADEDTFAQSELVRDIYTNRVRDPEEGSGESLTDGADDANGTYTGSNAESIANLRSMLQEKLKDVQEAAQPQRLYILTGYLESSTYGRLATDNDGNNIGKTNDKGDIVLRVEYKDTNNTNAPNDQFNERVFSHVYQQPVSANVSGAIYSNYDTEWHEGHFGTMHQVNAAFMRAEGSYVSHSYVPGTPTIRNRTIADDPTKVFAVKGLYNWYNDSLFGNSPQYNPDGGGGAFWHNEDTSIIYDDNGTLRFNQGALFGGYRDTSSDVDIVSSYEGTNNDGEYATHYEYNAVAGPRANYYIDLSSTDTSNIASYIQDYDADNQLEVRIPMYYSSIPYYGDENRNTTWFHRNSKVFNRHDGSTGNYLAGLYESNDYGVNDGNRVGKDVTSVYDPNASTYAFTADFQHVESAYASNYFQEPLQSDSANIWIWADFDQLRNEKQTAYGTNTNINNTEKSAYTDYNFYVRTKSETTDSVGFVRESIFAEKINVYLRLVQDMEYGIYVTDKSYLRDYYNSVMEDKLAQNYTYYSWETFRDATRLIEDYLNNYMQLADMYNDEDGNGYSVEQDYADDHKKYDEWVATNAGGSLQTVLTDEDVFEDMLSYFSNETQNVLCYLLTKAENQLFEYSTFQDFKNAYSEYTRRENQMGNYTVSSWAQYLQYADNIKIEGTDITLAALNEYLPESNDSKTDVDAGEIYDPNKYGTDGYPGDDLNCSWKIIYDDYFGGNAKEVFEKATEAIQQATNLLRTKATYKNLNEAMDDTVVYTKNRQTMNGHDGLGNAENAGITGVTGKDVFSIDRSTVSTLAETMNQGSSYYTNDSGSYTVSSVAALDKILSDVFKVKASESPYEQGSYEDFVSEEEAYNEYTVGNPETAPYYYSKLVRDDQQRFADVETGNAQAGQNTDKNSVVQDEIDRQARLVNAVLNQMQTIDTTSAYETFDYLIDVVSTIDFNAYDKTGQGMLWDKLYELLVEGGVYSVNQQLFKEMPEGADETDELTVALFNGYEGYYTGLNAGDVDLATTELMTLLTELNAEHRKQFNVNFTVHYMDSETGKEIRIETGQGGGTYGFGDEVTLSFDYDPAKEYAYSWVVTTYKPDGGVYSKQNLMLLGNEYQYTGNSDADVDVYVSNMPDPSYGKTAIPVTVRGTMSGQRNEIALNVAEDALADYRIQVEDDSITFFYNNEKIKEIVTQPAAFHTFRGWTVNGRTLSDGSHTLDEDIFKGNAITIMPKYEINGNFTYTVNGYNKGTIQYDSEYTITPDTPTLVEGVTTEFYAWLVDDQFNDSESGTDSVTENYEDWKIASYNPSYTFLASCSERFVQVNKGNDGNYYVQGETEPIALPKYVPSEENPSFMVLDPTSLYYRLQHKLSDSWSNIKLDESSRKISLYSRYTALPADSDAKVVEHGCIIITNDTANIGRNPEEFVIGGTNVQKVVSASDDNGQYMMSTKIPNNESFNNRTIYMRSYVTYAYTLTAADIDGGNIEDLKQPTVYVTDYSEIASVMAPDATN
ncbi:MAG: glycoside hydrolase family 43 protein [Clostridiales bacterium]|nr:glycoside hydrolase family 43 protein [Clostridiales bacterium]